MTITPAKYIKILSENIPSDLVYEHTILDTDYPGGYTLVIEDRDKLVTLTGTLPRTFTVPTDAAISFPIGTTVSFCQGGTGVLTISCSPTVTLFSENNALILTGQHAMASAVKVDTNIWRVTGSLHP